MRKITLLIYLLGSFQSLYSQKHLEVASSFVGVKEATCNNDGNEIEMFQHYVGLKKGDPWCAAFVSYCLEKANVIEPKVRTGLARQFKMKNSISSKDVLLQKKSIPEGSLVIWEKGKTIWGHVGIVEKWSGKSGFTIEGNTTSGKGGNQSNGDGVYRRKRTIQPTNYFRITSFTLVNNN